MMNRDIGRLRMPGSLAKQLRPSKRKSASYSLVPWDTYFDRKELIEIDENKFNVYIKGSHGPFIFLIHGGGHSGLSWACMSADLLNVTECQIIAPDLRGHGDSTNDEDDMSLETMSKDAVIILQNILAERQSIPVILVGHSMGGAIAVEIANKKMIGNIAGLIVVDVVEGTALDALSGMRSFLLGRPKKFDSLERAIEWSVRAGQIHNAESARVSVIGQLRKCDSKATGDKVSQDLSTSSSHFIDEKPSNPEKCSSEVSSRDSSQSSVETVNTSSKSLPDSTEYSHCYTWRIDLSKTEKYWKGWFENLSSKFLGSEPPKMLILAGVDRLDRELTIGQMQGKFQLHILNKSGHAVHEDQPEKMADIIAQFLVRYKLAEPTDKFQRIFPAC